MKLLEFEKLDSTNTYGKDNIESLDDKTVISADYQTCGHGRFKKPWIDLGNENMYISFILKPSSKFLDVYSNLTQYLSVCLCKQLEEIGLEPKIKWPNDVLVNGKKICGILTESVVQAGVLKGLVLGIGVNLNASIENIGKINQSATSVNLEVGHAINKSKFMTDLVNSFFADYEDFLQYGFNFIKDDYEKRASFINKHIKVSGAKSVSEGLALGVNDLGNLILKLEDGSTNIFNMGEIVQ